MPATPGCCIGSVGRATGAVFVSVGDADVMTDSVEPAGADSRPAGFLNRIHQSNKQYLPQWLGVPAHIHHVAYRMANPPVERLRLQ